MVAVRVLRCHSCSLYGGDWEDMNFSSSALHRATQSSYTEQLNHL